MSSNARYAPIPNPHTDSDAQNEMEAAFLESDDEDDHDDRQARPQNRNGYTSLPNGEPDAESPSSPTRHQAPGTYDFERVDYDGDWAQPPPGSPPATTQFFEVGSNGNSNGMIPDWSSVARSAQNRTGGWIRRVLPASVAERLGVTSSQPQGVVGGGTGNDGVFANVTAKPSRAIQITEGDSTYLVPEDSQKDAPPSYASAQADAVPPYWETTVHAPSGNAGPGDVMIDALPTGSLFSFLWNMLVSISFQFVGFLLTYLLHTTHAAKLGSRAGLGVTLIQYGFAMRSRAEEWGRETNEVDGWGWQSTTSQPNTALAPVPTFGTAQEAEDYYSKLNETMWPSSVPIPSDTEPGSILGDATTEWLSFFLMTVGWFILLTSLLSFWRVKRWEQGILSSTPSSSLPAPNTTPSTPAGPPTLFNRLNVLRTGLGFAPQHRSQGSLDEYPGIAGARFGPGPGPAGRRSSADNLEPASEYIIPVDPNNPEVADRLARAFAEEARLQRALRAAGLL